MWRLSDVLRPHAVLLTCLTVHVLFFVNWAWGPLRFGYPAMNYAAAIVAMGLSWAFLAAAIQPRATIVIIALSVPALVWIAACSVLGFGAFMQLAAVIADGRDSSFEPFRSEVVHGHRIVAYRTNGGATTSYGVVVRQETSVFPTILWTKVIYSVSPGYDVAITALKGHRVRLESPPYGEARPTSDVSEVNL